jgi:hypothetical protein
MGINDWIGVLLISLGYYQWDVVRYGWDRGMYFYEMYEIDEYV